MEDVIMRKNVSRVINLFFCLFVGVNANATVCFDTAISCSSTSTSVDKYSIDFTVMCGSANSGTSTVSGVAICSNQSSPGTWPSEFVSNSTGGTSAGNKYCYCRVIRPVVTTWYLAYTGANSLDCADSCTNKCVSAMSSTSFWETAFAAGLKL